MLLSLSSCDESELRRRRLERNIAIALTYSWTAAISYAVQVLGAAVTLASGQRFQE